MPSFIDTLKEIYVKALVKLATNAGIRLFPSNDYISIQCKLGRISQLLYTYYHPKRNKVRETRAKAVKGIEDSISDVQWLISQAYWCGNTVDDIYK